MYLITMKLKEQTEQLKSLLKNTNNINSPSDMNINIDQVPPELDPAPLFDIDFDKVQKEMQKRARRTLNKIVKHIIPDNMLDDQYVKEKMEQDIITLSGLHYQIYTNELMQKTLMQTVGQGNPSPRLFETFTMISKNIADTNKQLMLTEEALRKSYIDIKYEIRSKENETVELNEYSSINNILPESTNKDHLINRGSKNLINNIKNELKNKYLNDNSSITDAEIID